MDEHRESGESSPAGGGGDDDSNNEASDPPAPILGGKKEGSKSRTFVPPPRKVAMEAGQVVRIPERRGHPLHILTLGVSHEGAQDHMILDAYCLVLCDDISENGPDIEMIFYDNELSASGVVMHQGDTQHRDESGNGDDEQIDVALSAMDVAAADYGMAPVKSLLLVAACVQGETLADVESVTVRLLRIPRPDDFERQFSRREMVRSSSYQNIISSRLTSQSGDYSSDYSDDLARARKARARRELRTSATLQSMSDSRRDLFHDPCEDTDEGGGGPVGDDSHSDGGEWDETLGSRGLRPPEGRGSSWSDGGGYSGGGSNPYFDSDGDPAPEINADDLSDEPGGAFGDDEADIGGDGGNNASGTAGEGSGSGAYGEVSGSSAELSPLLGARHLSMSRTSSFSALSSTSSSSSTTVSTDLSGASGEPGTEEVYYTFTAPCQGDHTAVVLGVIFRDDTTTDEWQFRASGLTVTGDYVPAMLPQLFQTLDGIYDSLPPVPGGPKAVPDTIDRQLSAEVAGTMLHDLAEDPHGRTLAYTRFEMTRTLYTGIGAVSAFAFLSHVIIKRNKVKSLAVLGELEFLLSVDATRNLLSGWDEVATRPYLEVMVLSNNYIATMDTAAHPSLARLVLYNNSIERPPPLGGYPRLRLLDLSRNRIKTMRGLASTSLEALYLGRNEVRVIGEAQLPSLHTLHLRQNKIVLLRGLSVLTSLTYLNLRENYVDRVEELAQLTVLTNLRTLSLKDCHVTLEDEYRFEVLAMLTFLDELDKDYIGADERAAAVGYVEAREREREARAHEERRQGGGAHVGTQAGTTRPMK